MCLCLEPQVSSFNSIFFPPLIIFLQLDHMHMDYDSDNKHTPPPIPTFGWTGGLETRLNVELLVCFFLYTYLSYSTNNYCYTDYLLCVPQQHQRQKRAQGTCPSLGPQVSFFLSCFIFYFANHDF